MKFEVELENWRQQWLSDTPGPLPEMAKRVAQDSRRLWFTVAVELVVSIVMGGGVIVLALRQAARRADFVALAVLAWMFIAGAWAFALMTRRGCWAPATETTEAFLDLSIRRCRSAIAGAKFGLALYFCEVVALLAWIYHYKFTQTPPFAWTYLVSPPVIVVAIATPIFVWGVIWYVRRKRGEVAYLMLLRGQRDTLTPKSRRIWLDALSALSPETVERRLRRFKRRPFEP